MVMGYFCMAKSFMINFKYTNLLQDPPLLFDEVKIEAEENQTITYPSLNCPDFYRAGTAKAKADIMVVKTGSPTRVSLSLSLKTAAIVFSPLRPISQF